MDITYSMAASTTHVRTLARAGDCGVHGSNRKNWRGQNVDSVSATREVIQTNMLTANAPHRPPPVHSLVAKQ